MNEFQEGMRLVEAAERIGPILDLPPERVAGFVILVIDSEPGTGPAISASENIPPAAAAMLMHDAAVILAQTIADDERRAGCN